MKKWIAAVCLLLIALFWTVPSLRELFNGGTAPSEGVAAATGANEKTSDTTRLAASAESPHRPPSPLAAPPANAANQPGKAAQEARPLAAPVSAMPTNIPLPRFVGGHRANVPPGGALVTGGWPQPNGNRLLMFASPVPQADGETVMVSSRFLSIPPSRLAGGGWEKFMTDDAVATAGGVFSAAEYRETMKSIEGFKDVDLLSAPSLTLRYGPSGTIQIMAERIVFKDGKPVLVQDGLEQGIIARTVEGSSDIDLAVTSAQYDSGTADAPASKP